MEKTDRKSASAARGGQKTQTPAKTPAKSKTPAKDNSAGTAALQTPADAATRGYRTHTCGALSKADVGQPARLSGWVHRVRDHGGLLFIDLRDHYGIMQCVVEPDSPAFSRRRARARANG